MGVLKFFLAEGIETEEELKTWLGRDHNIHRLLTLRGIGPKTADYFKILVGLQTNAIDRHLQSFLDQANIPFNGYDEAKGVINSAADILGVQRSYFDHSIWRYMSGKKKNRARCKIISGA